MAVGAYGLSFGAAAVTAGLSPVQACALSVLVFTGASQFALVGVLGAGGGAVPAVLGGLLLGARNTLYAVRLADLLGLRGLRRVVAAHLTIDESTAMGTAAPPPLAGLAFWSTGLSVFVLWNAATLLGAVGAGVVDVRALGLDAAVGAAFLGLLALQVRDHGSGDGDGERRPVALVAVPLTPPGVPVLLAALAVLPAVVRR
ncbi:MAG TPA: AzlC family ABC transporter permease [Mycobacteriales bacterium]|nr:AzlC family ABC transporter permease [Mycobacteriales bacterium]